MKLEQLLSMARDQGILFYLKDGQLALQARKGSLNDEFKGQIKALKPQLIAHLEQQAQNHSSSQTAQLATIAKVNRDKPLPLSFAQRRLWFIDKLGGGSNWYNTQGSFVLPGWQPQAFAQALGDMLQRHEILRTTYPANHSDRLVSDADDEQLCQHIHQHPPLPLQQHDFTDFAPDVLQQRLRELTELEIKKEFDLGKDLPLRVHLIKLSPERQQVFYVIHHIAADAWSMAIFQRELKALYQSQMQKAPNPLPELEIQYGDFASWQQQYLKGPVLQQQLDYWTKQLTGLPPLHSLSLDYARPAQLSYQGHTFSQVLPQHLTERIRTVCKTYDVTLFMLMQSAFAVLLSRYSNEQDIVMGSAIAGRSHSEVESLIGLFLNVLVLRTDLSGSVSFVQLLERNKNMILNAFEHQQVPFEKLVEILSPQRHLSHNAMVQILFGVQNSERELSDAQRAGEQAAQQSFKPRPMSTRYELKLDVIELGDYLTLSWLYDISLFKDDSMLAMAQSFEVLLGQLLTELERPVNSLNMLNAATEDIVLQQWNVNPSERCEYQLVHQMIEHQVALVADDDALIDDDQTLSFAQLNQRANALARHLRANGVGADAPVAVLLERSAEVIVCLLAILKAGGAYVPLDVTSPAQRNRYVLKDSAALVVITDSNCRELLDCEAPLAICIDDSKQRAEIESCAGDNLDIDIHPDNLAYVIYTSGSTGKPKGVAVSHANVSEFLHSAVTAFMAEHIGGAVVSSTLVFDATVGSLWVALAAGKYAEILPEGAFAIDRLGDCLADDDVAYLFKLTPSHLEAVASKGFVQPNENARHVLVVAGEPLPAKVLSFWSQQILPQSCFINEYGPTETTVGATIYPVVEDDKRWQQASVPIGKPLGQTQLYVLNEAMALQPIGAVGELYIGGDGIARGYLGKGAQSAASFVPSPFATEDQGQRLYRSGDMVRYLSDGNVQFVGRNDYQVKVRGYRVELEEIETMIRDFDVISEAIVVARKVNDATCLVAYVVIEMAAQPNITEVEVSDLLFGELSEKLPGYMVPEYVVVLAQLPLTHNGKVDRKALPEPGKGQYSQNEYQRPRTHTEEVLCQLYQHLLGVKQVGINDSFFALGGHSLLATKLVSGIKQRLGIEIPLGEVIKHPEVKALAVQLDLQGGALQDPIMPCDEQPYYEVSTEQKKAWVNSQIRQACEINSHFVQRMIHFRQADTHRTHRIEKALLEVLARHQVLTTTLELVDSRVVQKVHEIKSLDLASCEINLANKPDKQELMSAIRDKEFERIVDVGQLPLFSIKLITIHHYYAVLLLTIDHSCVDLVSMNVIEKELREIYESKLWGRYKPLPPNRVTYKDYAQWEYQQIHSQAALVHQQYWHQLINDNRDALNPIRHFCDHSPQRSLSYKAAFSEQISEVEQVVPDKDFAKVAFAATRSIYTKPLNIKSFSFCFDGRLYQALKHRAAKEGVMLSVATIATVCAMLYRLTAEQKSFISVFSDTRIYDSLTSMVGCFAQDILFLSEVDEQMDFSALCRSITDKLEQMREHKVYPMMKVAADLDLSLAAIQTMRVDFMSREEKIKPFKPKHGSGGLAEIGMAMRFCAAPNTMMVDCHYLADLFEPQTIQAMMGFYVQLTTKLALSDQFSLSELPQWQKPEHKLKPTRQTNKKGV